MWSPTAGYRFGRSEAANRLASLAWLHCNKVYLMCGEKGYFGFIEAMHLLPQSFDFRRPLFLPRGVCRNSGTPPPSCCSLLSESLPHLLPRQAFSFSGPPHQSSRAICGSCPLSSVLSDDRVIPSSRTGRLNGNSEASRSPLSPGSCRCRTRLPTLSCCVSPD